MQEPIPFGKYLLLERISVGGMAEVFKAKSFGVEGFEKILAIKRILPAMSEDKEFVEMFIDEAKIAGQLSHANICQIFELGRIVDAHFIAMEFVWGKDVLQIQNRFRRMRQIMPFPMAAYLASKICEGLDYAHHRKDPAGNSLHIIHRDVSPQNILVSYEGEVKLIDFGIAKAASRSSKTQAGVLKGKFGYMSPEQVRGLPLDRRSDIFALGTILYELMTGERLFLGDSDFSTLEKVRNVDILPPSALNPKVPEALEKIALRALARDPEDRFQWASELQEELQAFLMLQDSLYTSKHLSRWMKETFFLELKREQQLLEQYKKIGRDGRAGGTEAAPTFGGRVPRRTQLAVPVVKAPAPAPSPPSDLEDRGEATVVSAPPIFEDELTSRPDVAGGSEVARAAAEKAAAERVGAGGDAAAGVIAAAEASTANEFAEDEPTVTYGDRGGEPSPLASEPTYILREESPLKPPGRDGEGQGPPVPPRPGEPEVPLAAPGGGNGANELDLVPPLPVTAPSPDDTGRITPFGQPVGAMVTLVPTPQRSGLLKDILIGVGVALVILGVIFGVRRVLIKPAPAPVLRGTLVVTGQPQRKAEVLVDKQPAGHVTLEAPLVVPLPLGPHEVLIRDTGCVPQRVSVELRQAGEVRPVTVSLKELAPAQLKLTLKTAGATVAVDGTALKPEALAAPIPLVPGAAHEVTVTKLGFESLSFTLRPESAEDIQREVTLQVARGVLIVRSTPSGATVSLNGAQGGETPLEVGDLDLAKSYRVRLTRDHFHSATRTVTFPPGETRQLVEETLVARDAEGRAVLAAGRGEAPAADAGVGAVAMAAGAAHATAPTPIGRERADTAAATRAGTAAGKAATEKAATEKVATGKATADKAAREKAAAGKTAADKAAREKAAAGKTAADKAAREKAAAGKTAAEKQRAEKAAKGGRDKDKSAKTATKACSGSGYLIANTQPWAKVLIDGRDTGLTTPIAPRSKLALRAGKHKVTFVVGDKKFHFPITIECGADTRLIQKLPVQ